MAATREAGFGAEVKRRIILGTYALSSGYYDAYYGQAQKVRTLISRDFAAAFAHADVLVSPATPTTAFPIGDKVDDPLAMYLNDLATIPTNLAGTAALSVPSGLADDGLPVGLQIMAPALGEAVMYRVAAAYEASRPALSVPEVLRVSTPTLVAFDEVVERFDPMLGLEVHVELNTNTKMFCGCSTTFGAEPNTQVCPTCLGLPGSLPVVNRTAVESAMRIGLALHCEIAPWCRFARKNYFYPDMPKNFQTSQYDEPIAFDGYLDVTLDDGTVVRVGIERAHMEEDTGKSLHVGGATGRIHGAEYSLLDYNRAGVPLIEIVTKMIPDTGARAPEVARAYVTALRDLVKSLGVSDVRMDQGSMRCDVNLSLSPRGSGVLGTRTETKNVNSLRSVERAVRYEMARQAAVLDAGEPIIQETRHFEEQSGTTRAGRRKETSEDYRYFPEPDLLPIAPPAEWVEELRGTLPELPWARRARLKAEWSLTDEELRDLVNAGALDLIEATVAEGAPAAEARSWWVSYLSQQANTREVALDALPITPAAVARVIALVAAGELTNNLARQVVDGVLAGEGTPDEVVASRGLAVVSDEGELVAAVDAALAAQPDVVEKIRGGKVAAAGAIVGAVMKATGGKADAKRVRELVLERCTAE